MKFLAQQRALQQAGFSRANSSNNNNNNSSSSHNHSNVNPPNLGSITVRCQMLNEHLRVEVLNARNLKPPDLQAGEHANGDIVQGSANEWSLGWVIQVSWSPLAAGARLTQPSDHYLADPFTVQSA